LSWPVVISRVVRTIFSLNLKLLGRSLVGMVGAIWMAEVVKVPSVITANARLAASAGGGDMFAVLFVVPLTPVIGVCLHNRTADRQ